jgi:hypothetical protein
MYDLADIVEVPVQVPTEMVPSCRGGDVTDAGLKELAGLESLRSLDASCTKVTKACVEHLKQELPDCTIKN